MKIFFVNETDEINNSQFKRDYKMSYGVYQFDEKTVWNACELQTSYDVDKIFDIDIEKNCNLTFNEFEPYQTYIHTNKFDIDNGRIKTFNGNKSVRQLKEFIVKHFLPNTFLCKLKITGVENEDILLKEVLAVNDVHAKVVLQSMYGTYEDKWEYNGCLYEILEVV